MSTTTTSNGSSNLANSANALRFAIPKGRMHEQVLALLRDAGIQVAVSDRGYRPTINLPNYEIKLLKPQNIVEMLHAGSRDVGFAGSDWVENLSATNLVSLLDTELDPVRVVAAGPSEQMLRESIESNRHLTIASEYEKLTKDWIQRKSLNASFVRAYGATECFPPEDADMIVDNTATGSTLRANNLMILDTVFTSSTHLYANADALKNPVKKAMIDDLVVLLRSVLLARSKSTVTFNIARDMLDKIVPSLPCMRAPSVSQLHQDTGFAISICVDRKQVPELLPRLKAEGATDIIVSKVSQIIA